MTILENLQMCTTHVKYLYFGLDQFSSLNLLPRAPISSFPDICQKPVQCIYYFISVPVIAPARPLKHRASVRDPVPLKARQDNGVQRFPRPGHGGELELLPGCSCDHTCAC